MGMSAALKQSSPVQSGHAIGKLELPGVDFPADGTQGERGIRSGNRGIHPDNESTTGKANDVGRTLRSVSGNVDSSALRQPRDFVRLRRNVRNRSIWRTERAGMMAMESLSPLACELSARSKLPAIASIRCQPDRPD